MNPYIQSLRLRTLPLSVSGIILGTGLAWKISPDLIHEWRGIIVFCLAILTTLSLQIPSSLILSKHRSMVFELINSGYRSSYF